MPSLIYGYGLTGKSFQRYLDIKGEEFEIYDILHNDSLKIASKIEDSFYKNIYVSPSVSKKDFKNLKKYSTVITDMDIFFNEDDSIKIGITGTNKKSTTCYHLMQLLEEEYSTNLVGNIGKPVLDVLNNGKKYSIIELSSFQLDKVSNVDLDYGILLNIDSDHLDYHENIEDYIQSKKRILEAKRSIHNDDINIIYKFITGSIPPKKELKDLPFRLQKISHNIINDSKSTNFHSLKFAICEASKIFKDFALILLGNPKKEEYREIEISNPSLVVICGKHKEEIFSCVKHENKVLCENLSLAIKEIKKTNIRNILFSPGYPSGDDYTNFEERGKAFNKLIERYFGT
jgi:UDP-N-acetylmuramoylalanine--D-glutamate ligase